MARKKTTTVTHSSLWHDLVRWLARHTASGVYRARWYLVPFVVLAAVPAAGTALAVLGRLAGWQYVAGVYAVALVIAVSWIVAGLRHGYDRALAVLVVALGGTWSALLAADPGNGRLWALWPFALVLAPLWWWGPTLKPRVQFAKLARRFAASKLAEDGGHLVAVKRTAAGMIAHLRLGRRWTDKDREELADVLDVPDGAIIPEPDPRTRDRSVQATVIDAEHFGGDEVPHPALAAGATADGQPWAPGARSILEPLPLGRRRDALPGELSIRTQGGGRHGAIFGATGEGKSGTVSTIVCGVAACRDARVIGSDAAKRGSTLKPWADVIAWAGVAPIDDDGPVPALALTEDDTARQIGAFLALAQRRGEQVADSDHDVWVPTPDEPDYVYVIDELAALLNARPELDEPITSLVLIGRQVGITVVLVSQGTDWDSLPTKVRDNLSWKALHRMEPGPFRLAARELVGKVDMTLFDVPGLIYLWDKKRPGDVMPIRVLALYRQKDKRRMAGVYRRPNPTMSGSSSTTSTAAAPTQRKAAKVSKREAGEQIRQTVVDAADEAARSGELGGGRPLGEVFASVPAEVEPETAEDEAVTARIVAVLRAAGENGVSKSDVAAAVGSSPETVLRRLTALRAAGRAHTSGAGARTRWHLTAVSVDG